MARDKGYWLVKCEPHETSFDDLRERDQRTGYWRGVRNYQARRRAILPSSIIRTVTNPELPASSTLSPRPTRILLNSTGSTNTTTRNRRKRPPGGSPSM